MYAALFLLAAALTAGLIWLLMPALRRYALARPNARSSHSTPTPQGAGLAVVAVSLTAVAAVTLFAPLPPDAVGGLLPFVAAIVLLAAIGFIDDVRPLSPWLRLAGQAAAAASLLAALPDSARALPLLPLSLELLICGVGLVWFINLTNFIDGIDGITVVGFLPMLAGLGVLAAMATPPAMFDLTVTVALAGALIGFWPFNRHVARVFLGDVGSLAIGGMVGWLLLSAAGSGRLVSALILALYVLADTGMTLLYRWRRGERLSEAHREHFYQRAVAGGMPVPHVTGRVLVLGSVLMMLALLAAATELAWLPPVCLGLALLATGALLRGFETVHQR
jgi:UDP-N-acetylmuramyl pentapeptide phosphotransferase/UDP-N-acetylglucosamine-1-phosphate transferase